MTDVIPVSGYLAGWAAEAIKTPLRTPSSVAAREARKIQARQEHGDASDEDIESAVPPVASSSVSLDLLADDQHRPQAAMRQVIDAYREND